MVSEQSAMWWVAHKILVSPPVPWIGDLGIGDWGLDWGLTIANMAIRNNPILSPNMVSF